MFARLVFVALLLLLPLQWGLAQAHDSAEEIHELAAALHAETGAAGVTLETQHADQGAHSQEPGGVCQFHDFAHTLALAVDGRAALLSPLPPGPGALAAPASRLAAGLPADIDRPRWPHHDPSVVALPASRPPSFL